MMEKSRFRVVRQPFRYCLLLVLAILCQSCGDDSDEYYFDMFQGYNRGYWVIVREAVQVCHWPDGSTTETEIPLDYIDIENVDDLRPAGLTVWLFDSDESNWTEHFYAQSRQYVDYYEIHGLIYPNDNFFADGDISFVEDGIRYHATLGMEGNMEDRRMKGTLTIESEIYPLADPSEKTICEETSFEMISVDYGANGD